MPATETLICPHCQSEFIPTVTPYQDDYILIDPGSFTVEVKGKRIRLTPIEHRVLACLLANANRVLTHKQLLTSVWGWEYMDDVDHIRIYLWRLRNKLEPIPDKPQYFICEPGIGYYFRRKDDKGRLRVSKGHRQP